MTTHTLREADGFATITCTFRVLASVWKSLCGGAPRYATSQFTFKLSCSEGNLPLRLVRVWKRDQWGRCRSAPVVGQRAASDPIARNMSREKSEEAAPADGRSRLSPPRKSVIPAEAQNQPILSGFLPPPGSVSSSWPFVVASPPKEATPELLARIMTRSNRVHSWADLGLACACYSFGTLMQLAGQSTFTTFMSMWGAGTYFCVVSQLRYVKGPATDIWQGEMTAGWLWMFAAFRQFAQHRRLRWAGFASWTGLFVAGYYSGRTILSVAADY